MTESLRAIRQSRGLTLDELGRRAGISSGNLSRIERGKEMPSRRRAQNLAAALGLPLPQFYTAYFADYAENSTPDNPSTPVRAGVPATESAA